MYHARNRLSARDSEATPGSALWGQASVEDAVTGDNSVAYCCGSLKDTWGRQGKGSASVAITVWFLCRKSLCGAGMALRECLLAVGVALRVCLLVVGVALRGCFLALGVALRVCLLKGGEDVGRLSTLLFLEALRAVPRTEMGGMVGGLQVGGGVTPSDLYGYTQGVLEDLLCSLRTDSDCELLRASRGRVTGVAHCSLA